MSVEYYLQTDVVDNLWLEYIKTPEYKQLREPVIAIPQNHPIVIRREEEGLRLVVKQLKQGLANTNFLYLDQLRNRNPSEWVKEWLGMQKTLFSWTLKKCGQYRTVDVWFDTMDASENLYKIPPNALVPLRTSELAHRVCALMNDVEQTIEAKIQMMAIIHFEFIRIHPFIDGNGRIGRVIIDQLCLAFGLPTAMGGYPRANKKQRKNYHEAIRACVDDPSCTLLARWIKSKIDANSAQLA